MGKLVYLLAFIIAIQIGMIVVFDAGIPFNSIWSFVHNPLDWSSSALPTNLVGIAQGLSVGSFVGGIIFNSDILIFAPIAVAFFSLGSQLINVWQYIASQPEFCSAAEIALKATSCKVGTLLATLFAGVIMMLYLMTIVEFWRNRD
jgi:hypothetical protein